MTVRTDNLFIAHYQGSLLEEFHYYPFGMCFDVSKSPMLGKSAAVKYNSQLHDHDEFEDANGNVYGLEDYNFAFRNYDAQIGRWLQPDPLMQHPSPYLAMSNNPVSFTDPTGLWDGNPIIDRNGNSINGLNGPDDGFYVLDWMQNVSWTGDPHGHNTYYVSEVSQYDYYMRSLNRFFGPNYMSMHVNGQLRPLGEAYGEAAARFQENLINGANAYNSGSAGDLLKGAQSGGGNIESLIRYANSQPVGFTMTGDDIANRNNKLGLASGLVKKIEKVNGGLKVDFTLAGRLAIKASPHSIPNGTVFKIQNVLMKDKNPALRITAPGATLFGDPFGLYLRGDTYSIYGVQFYPIFEK